MKPSAEQGTLKFSIALTVFLGVLGVASGLATGSQAIIFDGMFSFVDVLPTIVSLLVVKLIARGTSQRFQFGYWHLEPLVGVLRDSILTVACIYAAIDAVNSLSSGGHEVEYGLAAWWAGILCAIGLAMTLVLRRQGEGASVADARARCTKLGGERVPEPGAADRFSHRHGVRRHSISGLDSVSGCNRAAQHGAHHVAHAADWFVALHQRRTPGGAG